MINSRNKLSFFWSAIFALLLISSLNAKSFDEKAEITNPTLLHKWCAVSGEELVRTYKTNYIVKLSDGTTKQYASIRFLASDFDAIKERIKQIEVVDVKSQKLIDANKAFYVINSDIKTSYSRYSKLAFENEAEAKEFAKEHKGDVRDFDFTLFVASKDIEGDEKYFAKKQNQEYKKGQKIFERVCEKLDANSFNSLLELKSHIEEKNICGKINEDNLQAVSIYLWDIKRFGELKNNTLIMQVPTESKCPVCGMFVAKYPKWAAKIVTKSHTHYFDGVKDMMKFYFNPEKYGHSHESSDIQEIQVSDYYTQNEIDGKKAWFVLHSNVYGPMGNELIPFAKEEDAKTFLKEHNGKIIVKFPDIIEKQVYDLDR